MNLPLYLLMWYIILPLQTQIMRFDIIKYIKYMCVTYIELCKEYKWYSKFQFGNKYEYKYIWLSNMNTCIENNWILV